MLEKVALCVLFPIFQEQELNINPKFGTQDKLKVSGTQPLNPFE